MKNATEYFDEESFYQTWAADYVPEKTFKDYLKNICKAFADVPTPDFEDIMSMIAMLFWTTIVLFFWCVFGGY